MYIDKLTNVCLGLEEEVWGKKANGQWSDLLKSFELVEKFTNKRKCINVRWSDLFRSLTLLQGILEVGKAGPVEEQRGKADDEEDGNRVLSLF